MRKGQLSAQALGHTTYREVCLSVCRSVGLSVVTFTTAHAISRPFQDAEHAGFQRVIIKRNEPLADDDGYEIESDDTEERVQEAVVRNEGNNAYGSVRLERASPVPCGPRRGCPIDSPVQSSLRH